MTQITTPIPAGASEFGALPQVGTTSAQEQARYDAMLASPGGLTKLFDADTWAAAADRNFFGQNFGELMARKALWPDENFSFTPEKWKQAIDGIPEQYWERFKDAASDESIQAIRSQISQDMETDRILQDAGAAGQVANIATSIFNPENALITLATMGIGSGTALARGVFSIRELVSARGLATGLINALPNLATDSVVAENSPYFDRKDVFTNAATAFLFGDVANATSGLSRASRFAAGGAAQGLPPALVTAATNPDATGSDIMVMAGTGFLFGGVFNAIPSNRRIEPIDEAMNRVGLDMADRGTIAASLESGATLSPQGIARQQELDFKSAEIAGSHLPPVDDTIPMVAVGGDTTMGVGAAGAGEVAAQVKQGSVIDTVPGWKPGDPYAGNIVPDEIDWGLLNALPDWGKRLASTSSQGGVVANSSNPMLAFLGRATGTFGLSKEPSLNLQKRMFNDRHLGEYNLASDASYSMHTAEASAAGRKPMPRDEFFRTVGLAMREARRNNLQNTPWANDKSINAAINAHNKAAASLWASARRFDPNAAEFVPNQLNRIWNGEAIDRARFASDGGESLAAIQKLFQTGIEKEILPGIIEAHKKLGPLFADMPIDSAIEKAKVKAEQYARAIIHNAGRQHDAFARADVAAFSMDVRERVVAAIHDVFGDKLKPGELEDILFKIGPSDKEGGPSFLQSVIPLDETHSITVPKVFADKPGTYEPAGTTKTYKVSDFLENDVRVIHQRLLAQVEAHTHFKELVRVFKERFGVTEAINSPEELIGYMNRLIVEGNPATRARDLADLAHVDVLLKQLTNRPLMDWKPGAARSALIAADNVRRMTSASVMATPGAGIQQLSQIADILASNSLTTLKNLPDFFRYLSDKQAGKGATQLELQWANEMGFGWGDINSRTLPEVFAEDSNFTRTPAQRGIRTFQRWMYQVSGQTIIQKALERFGIAAEKNTIHERIMRNNLLYSEKVRGEYGFTPEDAKAITEQYKQFHTVNKELGKAVYLPNLSEWTNTRAAALYEKALRQRASRTTMVIDPSANASLFKHPLGKFLGSLLTFSTNAWDKRLLYHATRLHNREGFHAESVISLLASSAVAAALYALRTEVMSLGRPDREKYLKERLSWNEVAKAGFSKSSWSSLMPTFVGYGYQAAGQRDPFSYARVTPLGQGAGPGAIIDRTPFGNWSRAAYQTATLPLRAFDDQFYLTQRDIENAMDATFLPNALNIRNGLKWIYKDMPKKQPTLDPTTTVKGY